MSRVFPAKYPGRCGACDERFDADDPVRFDDDEIVHERCKTPVADERKSTPCPDCWLVHAGECP